MKNQCSQKLFAALTLLFLLIISATDVYSQNMFRKVNDFDGDGKADFAVTRSGEGDLKQWWIWQTTAGPKVVQWGLGQDRNAAGDYDGDGKTDVAVWRQITNSFSSTFYILESQTDTFTFKSFYEFIVSQPMQQDYNGDGKTDPGIITGETNRNLNVIYSGSESGFTTPIPQGEFGIRIGDMDGDGRADKTLSNGNRVTITNLETNASRTVQFGIFTDQFQLADFDGDGIGDLTVWRRTDGTWWWIRSSDNVVNAAVWGQDGDFPVPADYDGDGITDLAIWRSGVYWILGSQNGVSVFNWGLPTDSPVSY